MGRAGRPRSGEGLGETENCRIHSAIYADLSRVASIRNLPVAQIISPTIQEWLAAEFPKAIRELHKVSTTPAMMPTRSKNSREDPAGPSSTTRLPTWDVYRLNVISAIRGVSTGSILTGLLADWVKPELLKAIQEEARRLGVELEADKKAKGK